MDIERCPGVGEQEDGEWYWREGCDDCARRTSPGPRTLTPPPIVVFECEARLSPDDARLIWQGRKESGDGQRPLS
jgi:hypothetical protein